MTTETDAKILANNIVSDRTLRTDHLICAFYSYLRRIDPERAKKIYAEDGKILDESAITAREIVTANSFEYGVEVLQALTEELEELAPEGYSFGAHPGDGACFGFWKIEEEDGE